MSIKDRLRSLDSHSSVSKEFRVYTVHGAVLSVLTLSFIIYLVTTEFYYNFQVRRKDTVYVNATSPVGLEVEFDVSLWEVPCSQLKIDALDPNGEPQSLHLDATTHKVWKHRFRVNPNGQRVLIGSKTPLELGSTLLDETELIQEMEALGTNSSEISTDIEENPCGDCYGAGAEGECCDTCDDVKAAYRRKGWHLSDIASVKQCREERKALINDKGEGCNVHGKVALSTGGGEWHLAPGKDPNENDFTVLDMLLQSFQQWNVSHTIHKLRFGQDYPAAVYQLDEEKRIITDVYGMYQYYFKVVPTTYRYLNGTVIQTNQYSVTEHLRHVPPGSTRGLPGLFFFYEVSPLHVEITEEYRAGWVAFLTSVCAVVGGVITLVGMLDQYIFSRGHKQRELMR